jgi:hypothetical protein
MESGRYRALNLSMFLFFSLAAVLLVLLSWSLRKPKAAGVRLTIESFLKETEERHTEHMPQIRQALSDGDEHYLRIHCSQRTRRKVRKEREHVSAAFLGALKNDFENLVSLAQLIAKLSPQVVALHEWERLRLTVTFRVQFGVIRAQLWAGRAPLDRISQLSIVVSRLSLRVERAIQELGERAATAVELGSALNRHSADLIQ